MKAAAAAHARAKPAARPKKLPKAAAEGDAGADGGDDAAPDAKLKPKRRRSAASKKKETDSDDGGRFLTAQHALEDPRYERAPRLLPDIAGVKALSMTEANADLRGIQSALGAFEAKVAALLPSAPRAAGAGDTRDDVDADDAPLALGRALQPRRARLTAEEVVESLPACRRAVRVTQRELAALKRERDDLERHFARMRCEYVAHVRAMQRAQKAQDRLTRVLGRDVVKTARGLESSRRRTNALQDIMTELETRGGRIVRLTREKRQLEALLATNSVAPPEIDEVYVGDRVRYAGGVGRVLGLDDDSRILTLEVDGGGRAAVHEDDAEVLPVETTYADAERELKQRFFDKIGALVQPNGVLGIPTTGRRQPRGAASDDDSDDDDDDDDDDESDAGDDASDAEAAKPDAENPKQKKRRLTLMPSPGTGAALRKRPKPVRLIEFPACTIPSTPFDVGLLLSPLSTLPDRVAAVGPSALQWKHAHLPARMGEWEQERYDALQMKGELERLRFQLQKAEAEKLDAQQHATDQLESINQLVAQLDKLRESVSTAGSGSGGSGATAPCPHCNSADSRKSSAATGKAKAKPAGKKDEGSKRQHGESLDGNGPEETDALEKKAKNERPEDETGEAETGAKTRLREAAAGDDDDDVDAAGDSSDGASSKPATRSLRPRRKPTSNSTTASPKQSK